MFNDFQVKTISKDVAAPANLLKKRLWQLYSPMPKPKDTMSGYGYNMILTSLIRCSTTASNLILGRITFAGIIVEKAK